jgi:two-component system NarL family sensor kinase
MNAGWRADKTETPFPRAYRQNDPVAASPESGPSPTSALERRLARLRYDLHDGPQQDVYLLAQDLRLFRSQLEPMIAGHPDRDRALGRLDDLEAQVEALDGNLRRLSSSAQSPFHSPGTLSEAVAEVAGAFAQRTGIVPETTIDGDASELSESQQIASLALMREALSNVRKHSEATEVSVAIVLGRESIAIQVRDNGGGFDPEAALERGARTGRLGLVGMHERIRMLGGATRIQSRSGGPTIVSATLPRWPGPTP